MTRSDYIALNKQLAVDTSAGTGLFPSVMLAQAIVESNNGNSELAKKYNNHFGIKADSSWTGKKVNMNTNEIVNGAPQTQDAYFRVYDSIKDSYIDRINFLKNKPRYQLAGVFVATTPLEQLQDLQKAGYATDPNYAYTLNDVLKQNNLSELDQMIAFTVAYTKQNWPILAMAALFITGGIFFYKRVN